MLCLYLAPPSDLQIYFVYCSSCPLLSRTAVNYVCPSLNRANYSVWHHWFSVLKLSRNPWTENHPWFNSHAPYVCHWRFNLESHSLNSIVRQCQYSHLLCSLLRWSRPWVSGFDACLFYFCDSLCSMVLFFHLQLVWEIQCSLGCRLPKILSHFSDFWAYW